MRADARLLRSMSFLVATALLLAPAIWNGFPFLFNDSGAYFGVATDWLLSPGRSVIYGILLLLGQRPDFWPVALVQAVASAWIVSLVLRSFGLGRPLFLVATVAVLTVFTALPWLAGQLMPDVFAGLAVLAVWLLVYSSAVFSNRERFGLIAFTAFAAATHSGTFAVLLALLLCAAFGYFCFGRLRKAGLLDFSGALAAGAALLLAMNFLMSFQLTWTPGGTAFIFGRLIEDGIVARFLEDHCPDPRFRLCEFRDKLPKTAIEFLWEKKDALEAIGGVEKGTPEMRAIILETLRRYPGLHAEMALRAMLTQLVTIQTGDGIAKDAWYAYYMLKERAPHASEHALAARQAQNDLPFEFVNAIHVPVALFSMVLVVALPLRSILRKKFDALDMFAVSLALAILANAFVCGVLSSPQDRYGARITWLAVFYAAIAVARQLKRPPLSPKSPSAPPAR
jgi:hypothetical protein